MKVTNIIGNKIELYSKYLIEDYNYIQIIQIDNIVEIVDGKIDKLHCSSVIKNRKKKHKQSAIKQNGEPKIYKTE